MPTIRPLPFEPETQQLIEPFLAQAVNWSMDRPDLSVADVMGRPELARYVSAWGQEGDLAIGAFPEPTEEDAAPELVGVAWLRMLSDSPGYGWVSDDIPELSIAVAPDHQGQGIGRALLTAIISAARFRGDSGISLAVEDGNGSVHLYDELGFRSIGTERNSTVMLLDLTNFSVS